MTLRIRPLQVEDHDTWDRLWSNYLAFYQTSLPQHVRATTFARLLSDDPHEFSGLIAQVDGRPVGLTHFIFHRSCWKIENVCYLQDLFVDPLARGVGVGRALVEEVYRCADAAGAPQVYWLTQDFNTPARSLYDRIAKVSPFIRYNRVL